MYAWKPWEHWLLRGFAVLLLAFGVLLMVWGLAELDKDQRLDEVGVEVPAQLVRADVDDSGDSTVTTLVVRFVQRGDARIETTAEIAYDGDFVDEHPDAGRDGIRVEYDPDDPDVVRLVGHDDERGVELLVGAAVCAVVGAVMAGWAARAWRNRAR